MKIRSVQLLLCAAIALSISAHSYCWFNFYTQIINEETPQAAQEAGIFDNITTAARSMQTVAEKGVNCIMDQPSLKSFMIGCVGVGLAWTGLKLLSQTDTDKNQDAPTQDKHWSKKFILNTKTYGLAAFVAGLGVILRSDKIARL